jgi:hypothetical protein
MRAFPTPRALKMPFLPKKIILNHVEFRSKRRKQQLSGLNAAGLNCLRKGA